MKNYKKKSSVGGGIGQVLFGVVTLLLSTLTLDNGEVRMRFTNVTVDSFSFSHLLLVGIGVLLSIIFIISGLAYIFESNIEDK